MRNASWMSAVTLLALVGCGNATSASGGGGGGHTTNLMVDNNFFSPTPDTVPAGQVTFTWATPSNGHNIIWDSGPGTLPTNTATMTSGSVMVTLVAGTYLYHCSIHGGPGTGMNGKIVVQ